MSRTGTRRPPVGRALRASARAAGNEAERLRRQIRLRLRKLAALEAEIEAMALEAEERLGRPLPRDPLLLDLVGQIDVEPGDVWRWAGMKNNHGLPTFRRPSDGGERSVVRFLAVALGFFGPDDLVSLYPIGDVDDVNPEHRRIRENPPTGNVRWSEGKEAR